MSNTATIPVKVKIEGKYCVRRGRMKAPPTLEDARRLFSTVFSLHNMSEVVIQYKDEEGDMITVSSDTELDEACEVYRGLNKILFLIAVVPSNLSKQPSNLASSDTQTRAANEFESGAYLNDMHMRFSRGMCGWRRGMGGGCGNMMGRGNRMGRGRGMMGRGRMMGRGCMMGKFGRGDGKWGGRGRRRHGRWGGRKVNAPELPKKLQCRFVRDLSVPDSSILSPGQKFSKGWRVSSGDSNWPEGCHLVYVQGELLGASAHRFSVPATPAHTELSLSIDFQAPTKPGRYTSYWRMVDPDGRRFGHRIWVDACVKIATTADTTGPNTTDVGEATNAVASALPSPSAQTTSASTKVLVTLPDGSSLGVDCAPGETVAVLKEKLQEVTGVDKSYMLLQTDESACSADPPLSHGEVQTCPRNIPPGTLARMHGSMAKISDEGKISHMWAGFPTVAAPKLAVSRGKVMFEAVLQTDGVMQIGWCTSSFRCNPRSTGGDGVGDDPHSWAYDGNRQLLWHNGNTSPHGVPAKWKAGSVVGATIDADKGTMHFYLDGVLLGDSAFTGVNHDGRGFFPAASLTARQQLQFVFSQPFHFPIDGYSAIIRDEQTRLAEAKSELQKAKTLTKMKKLALREAKQSARIAKKEAKAQRKNEKKAAKTLRKCKGSNTNTSIGKQSPNKELHTPTPPPHVTPNLPDAPAVGATPAVYPPAAPALPAAGGTDVQTTAYPSQVANATVPAAPTGTVLYEAEVRQLQKMGFSQTFGELQSVIVAVGGKVDEAIGQLLA